jgi:Tfp pilus assembly protein PilO
MKLSRREILLLSALLLIGVLFGGYRFVYQPIQTRLMTLQTEKAAVTARQESALLEITTAQTYTERRDKAEESIKSTSADFLPGLPVDSVLLYLHDLVKTCAMQPSVYLVSPEEAIRVIDPPSKTTVLAYPIGALAQQYRDFQAATGAVDVTPAPTSAPSPTAGAVSTAAPADRMVGVLTINLTLSGTYNQGKDFLNGISQLGRTVVVTKIIITPTGSDTGLLQIYNYDIDIEFYGIDKIFPVSDDPFNWVRPDTTGKLDPFQA